MPRKPSREDLRMLRLRRERALNDGAPWHVRWFWVVPAVLFVAFVLATVYPDAGTPFFVLALLGTFVWIGGDAVYMLFFRSRIRTEELFVLTTVMGTGCGLIAMSIYKENRPTLEQALTISSLCMLLVWILIRGAGWGLWISTVKKIEAPRDRFYFMAFGVVGFLAALSIIPAALCCFGSTVMVLNQVMSTSKLDPHDLWYLLGFPALAFGWPIFRRRGEYTVEAEALERRRRTEAAADAALPLLPKPATETPTPTH